MRTREQELLGKMKFFYYRTIKCANLLLDKEAMTYKLTQEGEGWENEVSLTRWKFIRKLLIWFLIFHNAVLSKYSDDDDDGAVLSSIWTLHLFLRSIWTFE